MKFTEEDLSLIATILDSKWEDNLSCYIDKQTGELFFDSAYTDEPLQLELDFEDEGFDERYLSVPSRGSGGAYETMVVFTESVKDELLKEKLFIALNGKGSFGRFKGVIHSSAEVDRWYRFEEEQKLERARTWLLKEGLVTDEDQQ
jgi:hypothetical protein